MPPTPTFGGKKAAQSPFAAAAKVLFDSARKSGAVEPLGKSTELYAHQLKVMQLQSRKRGGSLGGVSYRVAEFLSTQRSSGPSGPAPGKLSRQTSTKKVPLLDIPRAATQVNTANEKVSATPSPIPLAGEKFARPEPVASLELPVVGKTSPSLFAQAKHGDVSEQEHNQSVSVEVTKSPPPTSVAEEQSTTEENVFITEDRPLFDSQSPSPQTDESQVFVRAVTSEAPATVVPAAPLKVSGTPIPSISSKDSTTPSGAVAGLDIIDTFSVDSWEQQREREIQRLQKKKEEAEAVRAAAALEKEHRTLGDKWVETRTFVQRHEFPSTEEGKLLYNVTTATTLKESFVNFEKLVDMGSRATEAVCSAAWHITNKIVGRYGEETYQLQDRLLDTLEKSRVSADVKARIRLRFASGSKLLEEYSAMNENARRQIGPSTAKKVLRTFVNDGKWEEAISLVESAKLTFANSGGGFEHDLLSVARRLEDDAKAAVVLYATESLSKSGKFSYSARLNVALLAEKSQRKRELLTLAGSPEADERVYAEIVKRTEAGKLNDLLTEITSRGLNKDDPCILEALAMRYVGSDDPMDVFKEIERQVPLIGLRNMHLHVALLVVKRTPTVEALKAAVSIALKLPPSIRPSLTLRKLLPPLYVNNLFTEIVELVDFYRPHVHIPRALPVAVAFANEALVKCNREPLSEVMLKDVSVTLPRPGAEGGTAYARAESKKSESSGAAHGTAKLASDGLSSVSSNDVSLITEKMLTYAKEKQWSKALEVLDKLVDVPGEDAAGNSTAATLTLIYNCALSAALERPDDVLSVYQLMKERDVAPNSTTVNTVLSCLSKSSQWEEAVPYFESTTFQQRDMNTYLVMVSLLGKHDKWEKAVEIFDEMKKANSKPPATMFAVAIGATAGHSWTDTLRIFQDMLKTHGSSVKDGVINQVIRCLEQNGRSAEVTKLEKEIAKKRKKKK